jgi:hypothetical protein
MSCVIFPSPMVFRPLTLAALVSATLATLPGPPVFSQTMGSSPPQESPPSTEQAQQTEQAQEYALIHVNAGSGSDASGDGSQLRPFQTISHALDEAPPGTIILLAPGEYSAASGEVFPLRLRPGVTVQGAVGTTLGSTIIRGNGTLVAANGTYMQVAIVGADGAGLANVTVTNPNPSGYGLVVEAGRPILRFNNFVGSGYAGAYVGGTAAPLFEQNVFSGNGSVGLLLADQSRAEVVANTFQNTGIEIQIAPGAEPRITHGQSTSQAGSPFRGHYRLPRQRLYAPGDLVHKRPSTGPAWATSQLPQTDRWFGGQTPDDTAGAAWPE